MKALLEIGRFVIVRAGAVGSPLCAPRVSLGKGPLGGPEGGSEAAGSRGPGGLGGGVSPAHPRAPGRPGPSHAPRTPQPQLAPARDGVRGETQHLRVLTTHETGAPIS